MPHALRDRPAAAPFGPARPRRPSQPIRPSGKSLLRALALLVCILLPALPQGAAYGQASAGYSEYYIPGSEQQLWDIFENLDNNPDLVESSGMHAVIAVTASVDGTTVYYDHWEDGYNFDPNNPATADETYTLDTGDVQEFESSNIPIDPRGTNTFYDGTDRIYVAGGPVTVTRASWPESIGTVFSLAWEIYPTKPFLTDYTIPVGQDLAASPRFYDDFARVYVIVQSTTDNNDVEIDDPTTGGIDLSTTLDMGEVTGLYSINTGTTVSADAPVQVQIIVGQAQSGTASEARGFSAVPDSLWDTEYYNPVSSSGDADGAVDLYLYNPNASAITISFEDTSGSGTFSIPADSTRSYSEGAGRLVPTNSGVHLSSSSVFWGIGSGGTESANFDWGFSLVPAFALQDHYYLGWAPGTSQASPSSNGSPVYITPVQDDTEVFVDYSPTDGTPNVSFTLDRLQSQKVFDPDNENTGMHIWATGDIAVAWGEDSVPADTGTPYLDLGYTTLPLPADWIDVVLDIDKTADPASLSSGAGQTTTFTLVITTADFPVDDVDVFDTLPDGFDYVDDSTTITPPVGPPISGNAADPSISGQDLTWDLDLDMALNQTLMVEFQAVTNASVTEGFHENIASASGTRLGGAQVFAPEDSAFVYVTPVTIDKDTSTPTVEPGDVVSYTIVLTNTGSADLTGVTFSDSLPTDFTFAGQTITEVSATRTATSNPSVGDSTLNWGTWTIQSGGSVTIAFDVNVDSGATLGTYDNTASADSNETGAIDDNGTVAQDPDTPDSQDPEDDEDVTLTDLLPTIVVTKTPGVSSIDEPGGDITFTVEVENTSSEPVTLASLVDDVFGDMTLLTGDCATGGTIDPGDTYTCSFTGAVSGDVGDTHTDTITAQATDDEGNTASDADSANVTFDDVLPTLTVSKTPDVASIDEPGGDVDFTVEVTNTSPEPVTLDSLVDDVFGDVTLLTGDCATGGTIDPGDTYTCSFTGAVSGDVDDTHTDTVTAEASDNEGNTASDADSADVTFDDVLPTVTVSKTPGVSSIDEPGGDVDFTVEVTNTSPEPVTLDSLVDDVFGDVTLLTGDCATGGTIDVGATYLCSFTGAVSGDVGDTHTDTVTAEASDNEGNTASDADSANVTFDDVLPTVTVSKTPGVSSIDEPGGNVDFTVEVLNTSPEPVTLNSLVDDVFGDVTLLTGDCATGGTIDPGDTYTCSFTGAVSGNAGDTHVDTITAQISDNEGNTASDDGSAAVDITDVPSDITVTKTASPANLPEPGGSADFTVLVENTSTVDVVTISSLSDDVHGNLAGQGDCTVPQDLDPGESYSCSFSASVTGSAGDIETDTVTASGIDDDGDPVSDADSAAVSIVGLGKTLVDSNQAFTTSPEVAIGEILTYRIVLQVGPGTMAGMTLEDVLDLGLAFVDCESITPSSGSLTTTAGTFADVCDSPAVSAEPSGSLVEDNQGRRVSFDFGDVDNPTAAVESLTVRYTVVVLNNAGNLRGLDLDNLATWDWDDGTLSDSAIPVTLVEPELNLSKSADPSIGLPGTVITFTLDLSHTVDSDIDAFDLVLDDLLPAGLTYVSGSLDWTGVGVAPDALDDSGAPALQVTWDSFPLGNDSQISYQAILGNLPAGSTVSNQAFLEWSSLPGDVSTPQSSFNDLSVERSYDPGDPVNVYGQGAAGEVTVAARLPATGFAPGRVTALSGRPQRYRDLGSIWLEIPALGRRIPVVGVSLNSAGWDLDWLWGQAGWLEGTAFPTWPGNSALTAHAVTPDGLPGPFARLADLRWGDRVVLQAYGREYVYEVRQLLSVRPDDLSVLRHEELDWLTLLTCTVYDEASESYLARLAARAVLVDIR